jgi:hypothetical protein
MEKFINVIKQIEYTIDNVFIFNTLLNSVILFLLLVLILGLFNVNPLYSLIPTLIYLAIELYIKLAKVDKKKEVEKKYDTLNEKLRTAADNVKVENPVVEELQREVVEDLKNVKVSWFLHEKGVSFKIVTAVVLCFGILVLSLVDAKIVGLNLYINNNPVFTQNKTIRILDNKVILADPNQSDDIYGEEDVAKLGNIELGIRVKPADYEVDVKEEGEVKEKSFDETFPSEVYVESTTAYEENIPVDNQELVKNYFKNIAETK